MSWRNRILEASYTSPSGNVFPFLYEDVSKEVTKRTTDFEFPNLDGTYIQDLGRSGRRFPIKIFFSGDDYDLEATDFENALLERGVGQLQHPIYGLINVVPFGSISRKDALVSAGNQAILEVIFWETSELVFPQIDRDLKSVTLKKIEDFVLIKATEYEDSVDLSDGVKTANLKATISGLLSSVQGTLTTLSETKDSVATEFNAINDSILSSIDTLVGDPLTLASQIIRLINAPARSLSLISDKIDAYSNLLDSILSGGDVDSNQGNFFKSQDVFCASYLSSLILSVVNNSFDKKSESLESAEDILNLFNQYNDWRESNYTAISEVDTGESYQQLQQIVYFGAGFLVEISFSLLQEKSLILTRNRTILDLAYELYPDRLDRLDYIINTNSLTGSDILELKKGKEILYYV